jgi:CubicO group peptidase (beta-lactamase class C family)
MTTDHITPAQKAASPFFESFWANRGWGFGLSIITKRDDLPDVSGRFGWDGGYGTSAYSDPTEDMVGILMTQRVWDSPSAPGLLWIFGCPRTRRSTTELRCIALRFQRRRSDHVPDRP